MKKQGHWVLKERSPSEQQLQSMPPIVVGSLKDSGIGTEDPEIFTRSGAQRSSFGMALKVSRILSKLRYTWASFVDAVLPGY